jgi:hypothetical protein
VLSDQLERSFRTDPFDGIAVGTRRKA